MNVMAERELNSHEMVTESLNEIDKETVYEEKKT